MKRFVSMLAFAGAVFIGITAAHATPPCEGKQLGDLCRAARGPCDINDYCIPPNGIPPNGNPGQLHCPDQFAAGSVCRDAAGECDLAEVCDGSGPDCPADDLVADGASCEDGAVCTSGETCQTGQCAGGTAIEGCCVSDADCLNDSACDGEERCADNTCASGAPVDCDDADACTIDGCQEPAGSCSNQLVELDPASPESVVCNLEALVNGLTR